MATSPWDPSCRVHWSSRSWLFIGLPWQSCEAPPLWDHFELSFIQELSFVLEILSSPSRALLSSFGSSPSSPSPRAIELVGALPSLSKSYPSSSCWRAIELVQERPKLSLSKNSRAHPRAILIWVGVALFIGFLHLLPLGGSSMWDWNAWAPPCIPITYPLRKVL